MSQKFCINCGNPMTEDSMFCPACGAPQETDGFQQQSNPYQQQPKNPYSQPQNPYSQTQPPYQQPQPYQQAQQPYRGGFQFNQNIPPYPGNGGYSSVPQNSVAPYSNVKPKTPGKGLAIASLVLGIIGLLNGISVLMVRLIGVESYLYYKTPSSFYSNYYDALTNPNVFVTAQTIFKYVIVGFASFFAVIAALSVVFGLISVFSKKYKNALSISGLVIGGLALLLLLITIFISLT